ncbi:MAG: hypothetical protein LW636_02295 [Planctomycetaceae bacterium]|nr:hypothetical protein [Planctomycetaceae bacterium]
MARTEAAVRRGLETFDVLRAESTGQPAGLRAAAQQLPADSPVRRAVEQMAGMFAQLATEGEQFRSRIVELSRTSATRPLPDLAGARSALAQGFRTWGDQIASAATLFEEWRQQASLPPSVRSVLGARVKPFEALAERLLAARQELESLPELDTDALSTELLQGEAAVVAGNGRLSVVPKWRIFPRALATRGEDLVSYSWGFRGEEVLVGAIRGISGGRMPEVVFMHAEKDSLFKAKQDHNDLTAVVDALRSAGFKATEWNPNREQRPAKDPARPQVFVALPVLKRGQLDLPREEKLLVEQVRRLVDAGEPVLLTVGRSMLALLGQQDPWLEVMEPFGLRVEATKVVLELVAKEDGTPAVEPWQLIDEPDEGTPFSTRLRGRPILFNQPMAVRVVEPSPAGVRATPVVTVAPSADRWLSDDWKGDGDGVREVPAAKRFDAPVPVAVLAERRAAAGDQRVAVVASGGWMLTSVADLSYSLGGGRMALRNPGNRELLLAAAAWLAGREDLLDAGLSGREVSRVEGLDGGARIAWIVAFGGALALGPIVLGGLVVLRRRSAA